MPDLADFTTLNGTLPKSGSLAIAASVFVVVEGARTMTNLVGDNRFSSAYGGELMGATYTGTISVLAGIIVKSPLPVLTGLLSIIFFVTLYHWQENAAMNYLMKGRE